MDLHPILGGLAVAALSIAASIHAILGKRTVSSAVAWLGVIWLLPVIGAALYGVLGINRIRRRATLLRSGTPRYAVSRAAAIPIEELLAGALPIRHQYLAEIARLGDRTADRPLLPGNRILPLRDGDEAYPAMLAAIERAERTVALSTYIFDNDRAGRAFRHALRAAVRRGVEVRVLVDDVGARYSLPPIARSLRRAGIPAARFNPALLHWRMPYFNLRNHRKILVIDGSLGFTGGINIRAGSWLATNPSHPVRDLHFQVEGPVVTELQEVFAEDWAFATGERLAGDAWFPELKESGPTLARGISDGPDIDYEKLQTVVYGALTSARSRVLIMTPYFIPDPTLTNLLALAALRGVEVRILLPERNNLILVQWASEAHWAPLLENGCRIHLSPPPFDHAKMMVVDGAWCLIGSANLDPRSLLLNFEFNLECYDVGLAEELAREFSSRCARAREVGLDEIAGRPLRKRIRNGLARLASPYL